MIFKLQTDKKLETGNDLLELLEQAVTMVRYNIGPEPIRCTRGPIYGEKPNVQRVGTWSIEEDTPIILCKHCHKAIRNSHGSWVHSDDYYTCEYEAGKTDGPYAEPEAEGSSAEG